MLSLQDILDCNHTLPTSGGGVPVTPEKIVIIGAGPFTAKFLKNAASLRNIKTRMTIMVVSESGSSQYTPFMADYLAGRRPATDVSLPLREIPDVSSLIIGTVLDIDFSAKTLDVRSSDKSETVSYDTLIIACGVRPNMSTPGAREHAYCVQNVPCVDHLKARVDSLLDGLAQKLKTGETVDALRFMVAGGGITGVEAVSALKDYLDGPAVKRWGKDVCAKTTLHLLNSRKRLVHGSCLDDKEIADFIEREVVKAGINVLHCTRVQSVSEDSVTIKNEDGEEKLSCDVLIWTVGNEPTPLVKNIQEKLGGKGPICVNERLEVEGVDNVWAAGDCVVVNPPKLADFSELIFAKACQKYPKDPSKFLQKTKSRLAWRFPQMELLLDRLPPLDTEESFTNYLKQVDGEYRTPDARMIGAVSEGDYLIDTFSKFQLSDRGLQKAFLAPKYQGTVISLPANTCAIHTSHGKMLGGWISGQLRAAQFRLYRWLSF